MLVLDENLPEGQRRRLLEWRVGGSCDDGRLREVRDKFILWP